MEWSYLLLHDVICSQHVPFRHCQAVMGVHSAIFVPCDLNLWPWYSNSSVRGRKHVFPVNLAQIHSVVPRYIWCTNKKVTDGAKNWHLHSLLHAVIKRSGRCHIVTSHRCNWYVMNLQQSQQPGQSVLLRTLMHSPALNYGTSGMHLRAWRSPQSDCCVVYRTDNMHALISNLTVTSWQASAIHTSRSVILLVMAADHTSTQPP